MKIIARPFLVSQDFGDGGLFEHLVKEAAKVEAHISSLVEAHPRLLPTPFVGLNIVTFKVRPPTPRNDLRDQLNVEFRFTRRDDSTAIQVIQGSDRDSIRVIIVLNEAGYVAPPQPRRRNVRYTLNQIKRASALAGNIMEGVIFATILLNPLAAPFLARGIETHTYPALREPALGNPIRVPVDRLAPVHIPINGSQPFPIAGELKVEWQRFTVMAPQRPAQLDTDTTDGG